MTKETSLAISMDSYRTGRHRVSYPQKRSSEPNRYYIAKGSYQYFRGISGVYWKCLQNLGKGAKWLAVSLIQLSLIILAYVWLKIRLMAWWLENGKLKHRKAFLKFYAVILGTLCGSIIAGLWLNAQNDISWGRSFKAQLAQIESIQAENITLNAERAMHKQNSGEDLFNMVVSSEIRRLPLTCSAEQARVGLIRFSDFVVTLESKGDQFAVSRSGAVSYTQFLRTYKGKFERGPMDTGLTRWRSYTDRNSIDQNTQWFDRKKLRENPNRFMGIPLKAQQAFMLVNIAEENGNDSNLAKAACGDVDAAVYLYVFKHHRDPGKEKHIWENIEDKLPQHYPGYVLDPTRFS